jgi:hypothetical protein
MQGLPQPYNWIVALILLCVAMLVVPIFATFL